MMSGSGSGQSRFLPFPRGLRPPTRIAWLELPDDHCAASAAFGSAPCDGYPDSTSQFRIGGLRVSNGIFFGCSAKNFENELSVIRPPFVSSSFSATQYRTLPIETP